jgi:hypothetical protein
MQDLRANSATTRRRADMENHGKKHGAALSRPPRCIFPGKNKVFGKILQKVWIFGEICG